MAQLQLRKRKRSRRQMLRMDSSRLAEDHCCEMWCLACACRRFSAATAGARAPWPQAAQQLSACKASAFELHTAWWRQRRAGT
eukprot:364180-Chlamydomonas_euryale.AAC.10